MLPDDPRHGTVAGYSAHYAAKQTPCYMCRVAQSQHQSWRLRQQAYGRWNPWVDAEPARTHIRWLMQQGMTTRQIGTAVGVNYSRITHLVYGTNSKPAAKKIRPEFAEAILAVQPTPARVPTLGVRRRLQALVAVGYSSPYLAARLGFSQARIEQFLKNRNITDNVMIDTHQRVDALYRELSMKVPSQATKVERYSVSRAKNTAMRHGWRKPLEWDCIDDPDEQPGAVEPDDDDGVDENVVERILAGEKLPANRAEKYAVIDAWLARGDSANSLENLTGWAVWRMIRDRQKDVA